MPGWLGWLALLTLLAGLAGLVVCCVRNNGRPDVVLTGFLVLSFLLVFLLAARFNMKFGQPQGRYLFPALGPLALLVAMGLHTLGGLSFLARVPRWLWQGVALLPPLLGLWVLVFWFQPAFDPELTLTMASEHDASLVRDITRPPTAARIQLLAPADGARLQAPPTLRWQPAEADAIYTVHAFTSAGRILFCTHEWFGRSIRGGEWRLPAPGWALLPEDKEIHWKVRRVPNRAYGETVGEMPGSGVFRFTRIGQ